MNWEPTKHTLYEVLLSGLSSKLQFGAVWTAPQRDALNAEWIISLRTRWTKGGHHILLRQLGLKTIGFSQLVTFQMKGVESHI
jgi:hypothetical protein